VIEGGAGDDTLGSGSGNNTLNGGDDNDTLSGGVGADTMIGGTGNDLYFVDSAADVIVEAAGQGTDRLAAGASYVLAPGVSVEIMTTLGSGTTTAINLTGNELANSITGNAANNILNGAGGADTMTGAAGNDAYTVDNALDRIVEAAGQGTDNVNTSVSYVLGTGVSAETLRTVNPAATTVINLVGNELANIVTGNAGSNVINGAFGNDTLNGGGGNDFFVFSSALNATANVDTVNDFNVVQDTIQLKNTIFTTLALGTLVAGAFNTGAAATQADDRIVYNTSTGALIYDLNGNAAGGGIQFAKLTAGLALTNADFMAI
jgi:Ca2+-binding RTX toxin-like protein